ncbi:hypothetical protein BpOF4_18290 [Alkalihalophilus pseudofirmus OF4]|jgi:hypothetical protein|uniref:Uncharacterized protein n=1 Tax=Alkalihalophilus pseudofirmus (strain ATCC BAA-2126 / JCM 17055 / OF4) TaxID=398511 RepID=D3FS64_ALKPO|nr:MULTISPECIES: hypothetical protein [Alkalihalophilus]ADC51699.1 hypothetical protein BpOF4_18290 [Alkalihalophilus pseudofirmus OF4]MED1600389.1 hypothetical protein [Alkalihalophilus marmarensis]
MFIFALIAFALLMATLFAIEKKLAKMNEQNEEIINLLKQQNETDRKDGEL